MNWVKHLKALLQEQCSDTERYGEPIAEMEKFWNEVKLYHAYIPSSSGIELFEPTDVRLKNAEEKLAAVKTNPACGIVELLQKVERNLRDWISDNQFGYLMDLEISEAGYAKAKVSGSLSEHASYGNKTKEQAFTEALDTLKAKGFVLQKDKSMNHYWFVDCDINKQLLESEFSAINARFFQFHSITRKVKEARVIREYQFQIDIYDLLTIPEKTEKKREVLNADDFRSLEHDVGEFISAYSTVRQMPELTHTCLSVMEGIFANLCKSLKIENDTTKEYYARYAEERAKNARIREIEAEIASVSNFKDFKRIVAERLDFISPILEKHDFFMDTFHLDCYGRATLVITPSRLGADRFEGFETFTAFGRADELEILDTETNKQKLENLLPMFEVTDMQLIIKDNQRCIRKVAYTCRRFL